MGKRITKKNKKNRNLSMIAAVSVLIIIAIVLIVLVAKIISAKRENNRDKTETVVEETKNSTIGETEEKTEEKTEGVTGQDSASSSGETENWSGNGGAAANPIQNSGSLGNLTGGSESSGQSVSASVSFPCQLDSGLTVTKIAGYDGVFIEDGSDTDISGVAAMAVTNNGSSNVEYAEITAVQGDRSLLFKVSALPAGATVVAMEANKASFEEGDYSSITAEVAGLDKFELSEDQIRIKDNGDNTLTVTNISGQDIPCVRLFYKYCMEDDIYVGGIAYMAKLTDLQAGQSKTVSPSHFVSGSSEVMMVRTYDSAE